MKNLTKGVLTFGLVLIAVGSIIGGSYAAKMINGDNNHINFSTAHHSSNSKIYLYQQPQETSSYVKVSFSTPLIAIYREGNWVKVGNKLNGNIGWVNMDQYNLAEESWHAQLYEEFEMTETKDIPGGIIEVTEGQKNGVRYTIVAKKNPKS